MAGGKNVVKKKQQVFEIISLDVLSLGSGQRFPQVIHEPLNFSVGDLKLLSSAHNLKA